MEGVQKLQDQYVNVEVGIFWEKLVHNCNKRGVEAMEGGKNLRNQ